MLCVIRNLWMGAHAPMYGLKLAAQTQLFNELLVDALILAFNVVQQFAATANEFEEALAGVVVAGVRAEVIGELVDP